MESGGERRSQKRIPARIPVSIRSSSDRAAQAETRDISASGIFLYTTKRLAEGSALEMVLMLPAELTQGEKRWICCQAEVIRVEGSGERFGVAAAIRNMDALPEIPR
jgi:c-di-GMP-binding flagellar brake protein YcgR